MNQTKKYCLTGFSDDPKQEAYKQYLEQLGCQFYQKLAETINILVTNSTCTQKFKIAKLHKNSIPCVNKKWIQDSHTKKVLLPLDKYLITQKQMFLGTTVAICGFSKEQTNKIEKIIKDRSGSTITKYKASDLLRKYEELPITPDVILATQEQIQRSKYVKLIKNDTNPPPLVRLQWLEDSLKRKRCKFPSDYAVNSIPSESFYRILSKVNTKLKNFLQNDIMDKSGDFLQNTVIHFDKECTIDTMRILKNLIAVCGGYWTDKFSSIVTHVLVADIDQPKYHQYKKYGSRINVVRVEWLTDSILLYQMLHQEDYHVRTFKITQQTVKTIMHEQLMRNNQNSQNFNSLPVTLDKRTSVGGNLQNFNFLSLKKKATSVSKSEIFKGRDFYILPELKNQSFYVELNRIIMNAGGRTYDRITKKMKVYVPWRDSSTNMQLAKKMCDAKYTFLIVSHRWITECLKKNNFIEPDVKTYLSFRAFDFNTPLPQFHKFIFEIVGYDSISMLRIRQLLPVLGSTKINPNKSQVTHILCGPDYKNLQSKTKINKIGNQNKKVQLIDAEWLFECLNKKKTISPSEYVITFFEAQISQTPQKKIEHNQLSISDNKTSVTESQIVKYESP